MAKIRFRWSTCLATIFVLVAFTAAPAQTDTVPQQKSYNKTLKETEVKFLYSYYEQDGNHSPVLGGTGTEYLTDQVGQIVVTLPVKSSTLSLTGGIDHYTSASTDNINPASISSASVVDDRIYFSGAYAKENKNTGWNYGINIGYSTEWDVNSWSGGFFVAKSFNDDNSQISFNAQHFSDHWELIYPVELRHELPVDSTAWRYIYNGSVTFAQVFTKKIQASFSAEFIFQKGYLATPFHRVYFADAHWPAVEKLPRTRVKIPLGVRLNMYVADWLIARTYYRYYFDDFDIRAHTLHLEAPVKPTPFLAIVPFYRFHQQTASKYFAPIDQHLSTETYFTSDYDLSGFNSHKVGLGLRYSPLSGIWRTRPFKGRIKKITWKKAELRGALYGRSDGLKAWIISTGISFTINH